MLGGKIIFSPERVQIRLFFSFLKNGDVYFSEK